MRSLLIVALAATVIAAAGCAGPAAASRGGATAATVATDDAQAVTTGTDEFIKAVIGQDYGAVAAMVWPGQAEGFSAQTFIDDRFRMKPSEYQIYVWDPAHTKVTKVRTTTDLLTSTAVTVRIMATNEARPLIVNLYWRKDRGKWWLLPYPEAA